MTPRLQGLVCALAALLPSTGAAADSAAILPIAGDQRLAAQLNPALGRAVAGQGQPAVLGPVEVKARLAGDAAVAAALERAQNAVALAREHELRMERAAAVAAAREGIAALEEARGALHAPELLIGARISQALALLLKPADPQAARAALRQVAALDPGYRPPPGQLSAQATRLLDEARGPAQPRVPATQDLAWVAQRLQLRRLVWIGLAPGDGERVKLEVALYDHARAAVRARAELVTTTDELLPSAAGLVVRALGGGQRAVVRPRVAPPPPRPRPRPRRRPRPWYGRWWVWTLVGAVAAGAAVGIGIAASQSREPPTITDTINFHF